MEFLDVYCGFEIYSAGENQYIAKNASKVFTANDLHEIYSLVMLHTI